jgi:hypothetical protein
MPTAASSLNRDFIVVDERTTVRQVRDRVAATGKDFVYIVVRLVDDQYAVLWLGDLIQALQKWRGETFQPHFLDIALGDVPDLLVFQAAHAIQQANMDREEAKRVGGRPGQMLVVLAGGEVLGLIGRWRGTAIGVDLDWLGRPPRGVLAVEELFAKAAPRVEVEPDRWINAEIKDHDPAESLRMGEVYTLAFDVDTQLRDTAVGGAALDYQFEPDEELVELTVQLESDDFEIHPEPQKLRVPPTGKSKGKARFDIEPKHEGEGTINAVFLKDDNFVQLITLKLHTGAPNRPGMLGAETLGRPVAAAFAIQPRDVSLTILNTGTGFQVIMSGAVGAMATLPITLPQLEQMIVQVRQELLNTVHLYRTGIDVAPEVNQRALQQLAKAGFRLYQRIFYGPAADAQANLLGDRLREIAQKERLKIQIFSQQFVLPWGILYMADEYDPEDVNPEMFLGLRHIVEHIPLQPSMHVVDSTIHSLPRLAVSLNVHADIDRQMGAPHIANQRRYWDTVTQGDLVQVIVRETRDEVTQALGDDSTPDQILYFYCHAVSKSLTERGGPDASTLVLSGDQRLTLGDLHLLAPLKTILPGAPLVFINACESAELSPLFYDGFVPYFMAKGARGVIGTECATPALFAAEWARRFFDRFLAGESLGQIFLDLRREFYYGHNNLLGLLYALYVDGDPQIVPGVQVA